MPVGVVLSLSCPWEMQKTQSKHPETRQTHTHRHSHYWRGRDDTPTQLIAIYQQQARCSPLLAVTMQTVAGPSAPLAVRDAGSTLNA